MAVVTTRQLLEAGVHFGHQTRRWNPKMRRFILGERNGIYIIDLRLTLKGIDDAYAYVRDLVAGGGTVLFVGTKKQTQGPVATYAKACGMPYVNERWLGGMLTNFSTISLRVRKLQEYEAMERAGDFEAMPKKEALRHRRELDKLRRNLGGFVNLDRVPDAVFVIDTKKEHIAVTEANKLGMPVVAVVDTNCDPDQVTYVIPGNDDAIRSGSLMCKVIGEAVMEGKYVAAHRPAPEPRATSNAAGGRDAGRRQRGGAGQPQRQANGAQQPSAQQPAAQQPAAQQPAQQAGNQQPSSAPAGGAQPSAAPGAASSDAVTTDLTTAAPQDAAPQAAEPQAAAPQAAEPVAQEAPEAPAQQPEQTPATSETASAGETNEPSASSEV
jgi:small subunit ribosomal protein S2